MKQRIPRMGLAVCLAAAAIAGAADDTWRRNARKFGLHIKSLLSTVYADRRNFCQENNGKKAVSRASKDRLPACKRLPLAMPKTVFNLTNAYLWQNVGVTMSHRPAVKRPPEAGLQKAAC